MKLMTITVSSARRGVYQTQLLATGYHTATNLVSNSKLISAASPHITSIASQEVGNRGCLSSSPCLRNNNLRTNTNTLHHQHIHQINTYCGLRKNISAVKHYILTAKKQSQINKISFKSKHSSTASTNPRIMAQIISGKEVSEEIRQKLKVKVQALPIKPKLAIVQVGGREDSNVYIRMKVQFAESIGATAEHIKLPRETTETELAEKVQQLNLDDSVHGIITQLPFDTTSNIDSDKIVNLIDPKKDVDGLCVYNAGKLSHGEFNSSSFIPCTPNGCMELIRKTGIKLEGTRSVVIGRSKIVGSPMALLLLWHNSTVTICHSKTKNLEEVCKEADIVVAAVGRAQMVKKSWLKPGAVVIDCGINVIPDATKKSGTRLVGDVDFEECKQVASAITPVPGGVGPMTVAMLIANTVESAARACKNRD